MPSSCRAGSHWDASVRILTDAGTELPRQRFAFALSDTGISEGQIDPIVTWGLVIAWRSELAERWASVSAWAGSRCRERSGSPRASRSSAGASWPWVSAVAIGLDRRARLTSTLRSGPLAATIIDP